MDPLGLVPLFLGRTAGLSTDEVRRAVRQAVLTAGLVAVGFMFLGPFIFRALGITGTDFQVAGGLILLIIALLLAAIAVHLIRKGWQAA